jgi:hypothetical protein
VVTRAISPIIRGDPVSEHNAVGEWFLYQPFTGFNMQFPRVTAVVYRL